MAPKSVKCPAKRGDPKYDIQLDSTVLGKGVLVSQDYFEGKRRFYVPFEDIDAFVVKLLAFRGSMLGEE